MRFFCIFVVMIVVACTVAEKQQPQYDEADLVRELIRRGVIRKPEGEDRKEEEVVEEEEKEEGGVDDKEEVAEEEEGGVEDKEEVEETEEEKEKPPTALQIKLPDISPALVREILKNDTLTEAMINCVIHFHEGCPEDLRYIKQIGPEIFRKGGNCRPACAPEDAKKLRNLMIQLQRHQPTQYSRLVDAFFNS